MKQKTAFFYGATAGVLLGAVLVVGAPLSNERVAAIASQAIYDCGVRIADLQPGDNVSGLTVSGNHRYGICVDNVHDISFANNMVAP